MNWSPHFQTGMQLKCATRPNSLSSVFARGYNQNTYAHTHARTHARREAQAQAQSHTHRHLYDSSHPNYSRLSQIRSFKLHPCNFAQTQSLSSERDTCSRSWLYKSILSRTALTNFLILHWKRETSQLKPSIGKRITV